ncbi:MULTISPECIES: hypothetical protein [Pseudomonas]|mgnify:CR=1 FL=1|jgi:hypothetical protein|uniref:Uncharacterized protein n=1 Tax=Pseudomonas lutea TaxID=243924 RepID=A0A9X8MHY0_9PSED|nr:MULTISPECIES: hypothetical protein [Pseudomonas]SER51881.1 hypothetical protein SAMN05216409_1335 [Pseudomonas lutea]
MPTKPLKCNSYLMLLEEDEIVVSQTSGTTLSTVRITRDQLEIFCAHMRIVESEGRPIVKEEAR